MATLSRELSSQYSETWSLNTDERITTDTTINPLKKTTSNFVLTYPLQNIRPKSIRLQSIETPNTYYNVSRSINSNLNINRYENNSGVRIPFGPITMSFGNEQFSDYNDFFTYTSDELSGLSYIDELDLTFEVKLASQSAKNVSLRTLVNNHHKDFDVDNDTNCLLASFPFDTTANNCGLTLGFGAVDFDIVDSHANMTTLGVPAVGLRYFATNQLDVSRAVVITTLNNILPIQIGTQLYRIKIPVGTYMPTPTYTATTFCGRSNRTDPVIGVPVSSLFYFPTLSDAIYTASFGVLPFDIGLFALYRKVGATFSQPSRPEQERFVISFEKNPSSPVYFLAGATSPLLPLGMENDGFAKINPQIITGVVPLASRITFTNHTAGFLGFYIFSAATMADFIDGLTDYAQTGVISPSLIVNTITIPEGIYTQNQLETTLQGLMPANFQVGINSLGYLFININDTIPTTLQHFAISFSNLDSTAYVSTNYLNEIEVMNNLGINPRIFNESSSTPYICPYQVYRMDLQYYNFGNNQIRIEEQISGADETLTIPDGCYGSTDIMTQILTLIAASTLTGTYTMSYSQITMKFTISSTVAFRYFITGETYSVLPMMGFDEITDVFLIYSLTHTGQRIASLNKNDVIFITTNMISGVKTHYTTSNNKLQGVLARVSMNRGRGGQLVQTNIYPLIRSDMTDITNVSLNQVSFRFVDQDGFPISNNGARWSMALEIKY